MPRFRPTELSDLMKRIGASPKRRYSQNFLIDGNVIQKIVELADIKPGDEVVEIGPGPGALTEALLNRGARVFAVEKDSVWADELSGLQGDLQVINDDVLECSLEKLVESWKTKDKVKVVANLPYHITTPILTKLALNAKLFSEIVVMVQDEVARRFTAEPGGKEYGSITVFLNFWADVFYGFKVKRGSFYPAPNVDSAMIKLVLKDKIPDVDAEKFFEMTRAAFNQRRKMLKVSLKSFLNDDVKIQYKELLERRPETLSLDEFLSLFEKIAK
ncbi:MAG: ribosomal RNA small subunit methyltransferase A [Chlamydiia bacterium]|nr:ribosomal RNA small subunit methyltransferase A [Chlamydiia bacterium]